MQEEQSFELWQYTVDVAATRRAYDELGHGDAESCRCGDCLNWIIYRTSVIPLYVQDWFNSIGVDVSKETIVSEYEGGPVTNLYIGEYLFVGRVLSGPDPHVPYGDGNGSMLEPVEIDTGFSIGLYTSTKFGPPIPESFKGLPLVNVMFKVRTLPTHDVDC
jgi:hypothetical protein